MNDNLRAGSASSSFGDVESVRRMLLAAVERAEEREKISKFQKEREKDKRRQHCA